MEKTARKPEKLTCFFGKQASEVFALMDGDKPRCRGYAAMFNLLSEDLGGYRVRFAPGMFDRVVPGADCRFLVNHDSNLLFGRTKSETLRLTVDDRGLAFDADPPAKSMLWQHYAEEIIRGDMDGCSLTVDIDDYEWEDLAGEIPVRVVTSVSGLYDVGPVTFPAFTQTSVSASFALEAARAAFDQAREAEARRARRARALFLAVSLGL